MLLHPASEKSTRHRMCCQLHVPAPHPHHPRTSFSSSWLSDGCLLKLCGSNGPKKSASAAQEGHPPARLCYEW